MRAVRFHAAGGREQLRLEEVPTPSPGPGQVLVQVGACGVNYIDIWIRTGAYPTRLPHILGTDVAGTVAAVGTDVSGIPVGQRVAVYPVLSDGTCPYCVQGYPNECDNMQLLGFQPDGGYAEYVLVPRGNIFPIPDALGDTIAAAVPVNYGTVWNGLVRKAGVKAGDSVLVWGAGSGVGSAAIQVAKLCGAGVLATAGTDGKVDRALQLGADAGINHRTQNVAEEVKRLTRGRGVDIVVDHVGAATWPTSLQSLGRGGRLVTIGVTTGAETTVSIRQVYRNELVVHGTYAFTPGDFERVLQLAGAGRLKPVIHRVLPLAEAAEAHRIIEAREHFGKLVLQPGKT